METGKSSEGNLRHSLRPLRPLIWWFVLVLVLFGVRIHQRLMQQTRVKFTVSLKWLKPAWQALDLATTTTLDGKRISNGERIPLGSHTFTVTHPKGETFSTNLFIFYGEHDLDRIELKRATGTLSIHSMPRAARVTVRGPEFSTILTNLSGTSLEVPTDDYQIETQFAFSGEKHSYNVSANSTTSVPIAPRLGVLRISSSHANTTFRVVGRGNGVLVDGEAPAAINELPVSEYEITAERAGDSQTKRVSIAEQKTNDVAFEFEYGAAELETDPSGATVLGSDGRILGTTPLALKELQPGRWHFTLEKGGFATLAVAVLVNANETNRFRTNLVNARYAAALQSAKDYFASGRYSEAVNGANEALKHMAEDPVAEALLREATGFSYLAQARYDGERNDFAGGIRDLNTALESLPENAEAKQLLTDYTDRQRRLAEQEESIRAKERATEERKSRMVRLRSNLETACQRYAGGACLGRQEVVSKKEAKATGEAILAALRDVSPKFDITDYEAQSDTFLIEAKQSVTDGSRTCVLVGGQVGTNESLVCLKVFEFQNSHSYSLLGGLITAQVTTSADHNGEREARFQMQMKEGYAMARRRIERAVE